MDEQAAVADPVKEAMQLPPTSTDPGVQVAEAQRAAEVEADRSAGLPPAQAPDLPAPSTGAAAGGAPSDLKARIDAQVQARADLKGKLEVVSDDQQGKRLANQVTAQEYDDTAARLGDVQTGDNDLKVGIKNDPNLTSEEKRDYQDKVRTDLVENAEVASGREQLRTLTSNPKGKTTTIELSRQDAATPDGRLPMCHDVAEAKQQDPSSPPDPGNATVHGEGKDPSVPQNATLKYVPGATVDLPSSEPTNPDGTSPTPSHVVFNHEGKHAVETTTAKLDYRPMTTGDSVDRKGFPDPCNENGNRIPVPKMEQSAMGTDKSARGEDKDANERRYRQEKREVGHDLPDRPRYYGGDPGNRPAP